MADLDPCAALRQADQAWLDLNTNGAVRSIRDQNGETIEYSTANRAGLLAYIENLQTLCPTYKALALGDTRRHHRGPMRFLF